MFTYLIYGLLTLLSRDGMNMLLFAIPKYTANINIMYILNSYILSLTQHKIYTAGLALCIKCTCTEIKNNIGKNRMNTHSDILLFFLSWCIANMTPPRTTAIINTTIITIAGTSAGELRAGMWEKIVSNNCVKSHAYCIAHAYKL